MTHLTTRRQETVSDNNTSPSDSSEGGCSSSDNFEIIQEDSNNLFISKDVEINEDCLNMDTNGILSDIERAQIESFFSGLGTSIFVSSALANLYENLNKTEWRLIYTGIPVLIYDKGSARSRTIPRVTLILAERGTCFALWQDKIDNLSAYKVDSPSFHTMCLSSDHTKTIGFSFDSNHAAREIWLYIEKLISDPQNISLNVPGRKSKQSKQIKLPVLPSKSQISHPCQFQHVTSVTSSDTQRYFSLQAFVSSSNKHREH